MKIRVIHYNWKMAERMEAGLSWLNKQRTCLADTTQKPNIEFF